MSDFKDMEQFARHVRREAASLMTALCEDLGAEHPSTLKALALVTSAAKVARETAMQQEVVAGNYDLAALHVHADTPSNSETGWERED